MSAINDHPCWDNRHPCPHSWSVWRDKHNTTETACSTDHCQNWCTRLVVDMAATVCTSPVTNSCPVSAGMILDAKGANDRSCRRTSSRTGVVDLRRNCFETSNPLAGKSSEEDMKEQRGNYYRRNYRKSPSMDLAVNCKSYRKADMLVDLSSVHQRRTTLLAFPVFHMHTNALNDNNIHSFYTLQQVSA